MFLGDPDRSYGVLRRTIRRHLAEAGASDLWEQAQKVLALDRALSPRTGPSRTIVESFDFEANLILAALGAMQRPDRAQFASGMGVELEIQHPAQVGEVLLDPDGGAWMRGRIRSARRGGRRGTAPPGTASSRARSTGSSASSLPPFTSPRRAGRNRCSSACRGTC
jgi:hypothetical protein